MQHYASVSVVESSSLFFNSDYDALVMEIVWSLFRWHSLQYATWSLYWQYTYTQTQIHSALDHLHRKFSPWPFKNNRPS